VSHLEIKSSLKSYEVLIEDGLLDHLEPHLDPAVFYVIIADDGIPQIYLDKVAVAVPWHVIVRFPQGEAHKNLAEFTRVIDIMIRQNVKKDSCVIALGGGVTGDLAGFAASVYLRGIPLIQIPTTLLAQIDSSVGGKVGIDAPGGKNMVGSFYPPEKVLIDPKTLDTLPERQKMNGMAEMIKYGMIADRDLFYQIKNEDVFQNIEYFIHRSLLAKKRFVEEDEFDIGIRQSLNFGHTIGHALEAYFGYDRLLHGEAVAIGMAAIVSSPEIRKELVECLRKYHLPTENPVDMELLKEYINRDKKSRKDLLKIVDVTEIGSAVLIKSQFRF
jgi:3-dehydroquinate synthase